MTAKPGPRKKPEPPATTDEVGYGKPPKEHQFKPGQSGNPKGRRRGARSASTIYRELIEEKISIVEGGKEKKLTRLEIIYRQLAAKAMKADPKAAAQILQAGRDLGIIAAEKIDPDAEAQKKLAAEDLEIMKRYFPDVRPGEEG